MKKTVIDDVELVLAEPVANEIEWIGQRELTDQVLAAWLVVDDRDLPLCPRLIGKPGVGKTTLASSAARLAGLDLYVFQCTMDTRPEDLLVTPVLSRAGKISYHASPLVTAMLTGGAVVLDEANRMSEKSWASLAPLLDHRRYVDSVVAGVRVPASPSFRACVTMNDDASTFEVPDYMLSRLQPAVEVGYPDTDDELQILRYHLPFAPEDILALTVGFLQGGHAHGLPYSVRDGINIVRFALKTARRTSATGDAGEDTEPNWHSLFEASTRQILGEDAFDFEKASLQADAPSFLDLRDLFETLGELDGDEEDEDDEESDVR